MPKTLIAVNPNGSAREQSPPIHNRFHPSIPAVASVHPGDVFRVECMDWFGGTIGNNDNADDVRDADLDLVHCLTGPIAVDGAQPGDLLAVDILDIQPHPARAWGYTGIFPHAVGGFLTDRFPDPRKAVWDFAGIFASSRHVPGVRFAGISHPGIVATAPSMEMLERWNRREGALIETAPQRKPPLAMPPTPHSAIVGALSGSNRDRAAREGARTVPPRELGGNMDIKNLTRGSRIFLPVYVPGGNLSVGDCHFSQGDGEITLCGAIEMAGVLDLQVDLVKGGMSRYGVVDTFLCMTGPMEPRYTEYLVFEGISVDEQGAQRYLDANVAYRRACLHAIEYLARFGFTEEQVYVLLSTAPIEGRVSGIVDIPNACCTIYVPTAIFDVDIRPSSSGPKVVRRGDLARPTSP